MEWFKDKEEVLISEQCDFATDQKNEQKLLELAEQCKKLGDDKNFHPVLRAKYYYNSFTCFSNYSWIAAKVGEDREELQEKSLLLSRKSILLLEAYHPNIISEIEEAYFNGLYFQVVVNHCNLLIEIFRIPQAISIIKRVAKNGFGMAIGNLGMELKDYAMLEDDEENKQFLFEKSALLLKYVNLMPSADVHTDAKKRFEKELLCILGENPEEKWESLKDIRYWENLEEKSKDYHVSEEDYWEWCQKNSLILDVKNDIETNMEMFDNLHLPSIVASIKETTPKFHGLFNQIKQEYCSARFMMFEGIYSEKHFSDKHVKLVNTLDYSDYGLGIERMKASFRACYSVLDRIAYFLNDYYNLGLNDNKVDFGKIWNAKNTKKLREASKKNLILRALFWMKKDLSPKPIKDFSEFLDPMLNRAYVLRNTIEHRYLKVVNDIFILNSEELTDPLATVISMSSFQEISLYLLKTCRESIILLYLAIIAEERNKQSNLEGEVLPSFLLSEFDDDWKV